MTGLNVELPAELEKSLHEFGLDWSGVARKAIFEKVEALRKLKKLSSGIKVPDELAKEFTDQISESVARRFRGAK
jgi:hypothetical protein